MANPSFEERYGNQSHMQYVMNFKESDEGVLAVAPTIYALKELLEFLTSPTVNIPVRALDVGTITPVEIRKARIMSLGKRQFSTILGFEVNITPEASELANRLHVKIICGDMLGRLSQQFEDHTKELGEETADGEAAIFPCILHILPDLVFNKDDPFLLGVVVLHGVIKVGVPVCNPRSDRVDIGRVVSIVKHHIPVKVASQGETVIIKIVALDPEEEAGGFGSHFDLDDILVSRVSRGSINALKAKHKDELSMTEWRFVSDLKCIFNIK